MIEKLQESRDTAFGFKVTGKLTPEDIAAIAPQVEATIASHKRPIGLLADLSAMHGGSWSARWAEFHFLKDHADSIARLAIISDEEWPELGEMVLTTVGGLEAQTLYFHSSELVHAWHWVRMAKPDNSMPVRVIYPGKGLFRDYTPEYMGL